MTTHVSFPNPDRPFRWDGEESHYRSTFNVGDRVRADHGTCGVIVAFDNTWSHVNAGRIVHIQPDAVPEPARVYDHKPVCWEDTLTPAEADDVPAHVDRPGFGWRHVPASWMATT